MEGVSASHVSEAWWTEACKKVKNALVFIDEATAESLHWSGGLGRLADAGAKNVKEFSSFEVRMMAINSLLVEIYINYVKKLLRLYELVKKTLIMNNFCR